MNDIHDIRPPIDPGVLIYLLLICIIIVVVSVLLILLIKKYINKKKPPQQRNTQIAINFMSETIDKLQELQVIADKAETHSQYKQIYFDLSLIVKWGISGIYRIPAEAMTKNEITVNVQAKFDELLECLYQVQYAQRKTARQQTKLIINSAIKTIKTCK